MPKRYHISEEQIRELKTAQKENKEKNNDKRLKALLLHAQGKKREEIAKETGFVKTYISEIVSKYCNFGIKSIIENKQTGNRRNISYAQEESLLAEFERSAANGNIITVQEIKAAYEERIGHNTGGETIYKVLERHGWRKIMPRSKHPNKSSDEAIEASKKLT